MQGDDAAPMIAKQIERVGVDDNYDTLIVARGGGSRGDLWAFNSEEVGRAIAACPIPVISSVGHEVDTTIADLVADDREATPTSAAVKASEWLLSDVLDNLNSLRQQLYHLTRLTIDRLQDHLNDLQNNFVFCDPRRILDQPTQQLDDLKQQLSAAVLQQQRDRRQEIKLLQTRLAGQSPVIRMQRDQDQLQSLQKMLISETTKKIRQSQLEASGLIKQLLALDPEKILARGYSYVTSKNQVIKSVKQLKANEPVTIHLTDGEIVATVTEVKTRKDQNGNH